MSPWQATVLALSLTAAWPASGAVFGVDSTLDEVDAAAGDGVCASAGGVCTLRAAIMETNALVGEDTLVLPAGTYRLALGGPFVGEGLIASGAGAAVTTMDATGLQPRVAWVFEIERRPVGPVDRPAPSGH